MKVYDVFAEEWVTPDEIDIIAPPERYIYMDDSNAPFIPYVRKNKSVDEVIEAIKCCPAGNKCNFCSYSDKGCVDTLLVDAQYHLERYRSLCGE